MRPLHYQGRLPRSGLRLLEVFIKPASACFTPENLLVGVVERPLGPRRRICLVQGAGMGAPIPGALGVALCRARRAHVAAVVSCGARGGAAGGAPPGLARAGVETPPSPVEVGPSSSLREPASRPSWLVGPGGGMVPRLLSRNRNRPAVVPSVSSRGISSELSLSRGHPGWGAWKTSACPECPASSLGDMLLVGCREGSGRGRCGEGGGMGTARKEAMEAGILLRCPCCK